MKNVLKDTNKLLNKKEKENFVAND